MLRERERERERKKDFWLRDINTILIHTHSHTHTHTQTHTPTHTQTHTNTHKHTNTNTHILTHTHRHTHNKLKRRDSGYCRDKMSGIGIVLFSGIVEFPHTDTSSCLSGGRNFDLIRTRFDLKLPALRIFQLVH